MTNPETPSAAPVAWCRSDDFAHAAQTRQSLVAWREQHPDCDMPLYTQPQASTAPDADQVEGPSLDDVAELCAEFGFDLLDDDFGESLDVLRDMITAAITRWRAPVAESVATPAPQEPNGDRVQKLAAIIREVDPARLPRAWSHQFAQALLAHPGFSGCHDGPAAHSAQGEVAELVEFLSGVADWQQHQCHADKVRRAAELLKGIPHA